MDTIEISLRIIKELSIMLIERLRRDINSLVSPYGYTFCDVLEVSSTGNLIIKISYPRYFFGNNAYLITKRSECFEVQKYFVDNIMEDPYWKDIIGEINLLRVDIPFTYQMRDIITKRSECFEVQKYFVDNIMEDPYWKDIIGEINLLRVDIPFTYQMRDNEEFNSYENVFQICAIVYNRTKNKARPKAFIDMIDRKLETVIYSDNGKSDKSSNNKLMIYNQYLNLNQKLDEEVFEETLKAYGDLPYRIRMEVSKRVRLRKSFNGQEFANLDILGNYFEQYKNYILDYVLNKEEIDWLEVSKRVRLRKSFNGQEFANLDILGNYFEQYKNYILDYVLNKEEIDWRYNYWSEQLVKVLIENRAKGNFNYKVFILQNLSTIYDYEILRRALGSGIENISTRENAITRVRKILNDIQQEKNIIVMNTYAVLMKMRETIINYRLMD